MSDEILFAPPPSEADTGFSPPWKVLIVDDEDSVHQVTQLVFKHVTFDGRPVMLLEARSAHEAMEILTREGSEIALALIDVVMESDDAGLKLIKFIREEQCNQITRLVLRTGQPGQAPEEAVIQQYDINDYKEKAELTGIKLKTLLYSTLRSYRDILTIDNQRKSLEKVIRAIGQVNSVSSLTNLASAILDQLISLLGFQPDAIYCCTRRMYRTKTLFTVLAATGKLEAMLGTTNSAETSLKHYDEAQLPQELQAAFNQALNEKRSIHTSNGYVAYHAGVSGSESLLFIKHMKEIKQDSKHLVEIFTADVVSTYHALLLKEDALKTQEEMIYILGGAVESRSKETGAHVKRVAEISALLAKKYGTNQIFIDNLRLVSPLHDIGKIAIPDAVLNKPGKLTADEWRQMQTHAAIGERMLQHADNPIFQMAAKIAGTHHEKWDGSGYPKGLSGDSIPLSGRITAIADVFDALNSKRCYKERWSVESIIELIRNESGKHFEPRLVDIFLDELDDVLEIYARFPD